MALVNIANWVVFAFGTARVVIDKCRIDGSILSIRFNRHSLVLENDPTLPLCSLEVEVLRVVYDLSK